MSPEPHGRNSSSVIRAQVRAAIISALLGTLSLVALLIFYTARGIVR